MFPCKALQPGLRPRPRLQGCPGVSLSARTYPSTRWQSVSSASRNPLVLRATGTDGTTSTAPSSSSSSTDERIKTTISDLDALLGIQEEPAANEAKVNKSGGRFCGVSFVCGPLLLCCVTLHHACMLTFMVKAVGSHANLPPAVLMVWRCESLCGRFFCWEHVIAVSMLSVVLRSSPCLSCVASVTICMGHLCTPGLGRSA
jgi:hypothetical protein